MTTPATGAQIGHNWQANWADQLDRGQVENGSKGSAEQQSVVSRQRIEWQAKSTVSSFCRSLHFQEETKCKVELPGPNMSINSPLANLTFAICIRLFGISIGPGIQLIDTALRGQSGIVIEWAVASQLMAQTNISSIKVPIWIKTNKGRSSVNMASKCGHSIVMH